MRSRTRRLRRLRKRAHLKFLEHLFQAHEALSGKSEIRDPGTIKRLNALFEEALVSDNTLMGRIAEQRKAEEALFRGDHWGHLLFEKVPVVDPDKLRQAAETGMLGTWPRETRTREELKSHYPEIKETP
jgi:hypothetical protein